MIVVFDVETKKAFDEVGGYYPERLGVSMVGTWTGVIDGDGEYRAYREDEIGEVFRHFERADLVVGFNSISFDYPALNPYYAGDLTMLPTLDMFVEVEKAVGHRVGLDALVKETLGKQKSGKGLDAIAYYHAGDWESLEKYCLQDVRMTKELYEYGLKNRTVKFMNKWNRIVEVDVDFSRSADREKSVQTTMF